MVCACMNSPTWWPGRPKLSEHAPAGAVHDVDLLIDFIDDVHVLLVLVAGKFDRGSRSHQHARRAGIRLPVAGMGVQTLKAERHVFLEIAHGVEDLEAVHPAVAHVDHAVVADADAMRSGRAAVAASSGDR